MDVPEIPARLKDRGPPKHGRKLKWNRLQIPTCQALSMLPLRREREKSETGTVSHCETSGMCQGRPRVSIPAQLIPNHPQLLCKQTQVTDPTLLTG